MTMSTWSKTESRGRWNFRLIELILVCDDVDIVKNRIEGTVKIPFEDGWLGNAAISSQLTRSAIQM